MSSGNNSFSQSRTRLHEVRRTSACCASAKSRAASEFRLRHCAPGRWSASSRRNAQKASIGSTPKRMCGCCSALCFLRRARGLNPAAIVHVLKGQGIVSAPAEKAIVAGTTISPAAHAARAFAGAGCACDTRISWISQRARTRTDALFGRDAAAHCALLSHEHSVAIRSRRRKSRPRAAASTQNPGNNRRRTNGASRMGPHRDGATSVLH